MAVDANAKAVHRLVESSVSIGCYRFHVTGSELGKPNVSQVALPMTNVGAADDLTCTSSIFGETRPRLSCDDKQTTRGQTCSITYACASVLTKYVAAPRDTYYM